MFELLDKACTMETRYKFLHPVAIENDPAYITCDPYDICTTQQEEHGKLISDSDWRALATKLPKSNSAGTEERSPTPDTPSQNQVQCHR